MLPRALLLVIVAAGLCAALVWSKWQPPTEKISGFIEADEIRLGSRIGGRVARVLVEEGDDVKKGELLVELEPYDLDDREAEARARLAARRAEYEQLKRGFRDEEIAQAEYHYRQLKANYEKLVEGPRTEEIEAARARLKVAESQRALARQEFRRVEELYQQNAETRAAYDTAIQQLAAAQGDVAVRREELTLLEKGTRDEEIAAAQAQMEEALAAWQLKQNGYRPEEIESARAAADQADAALQTIRSQKKELQIRAPLDGAVESLDLEPGDLAGANAPVMSMLDTARLWVRAYLPADMHLEIGQQVPLSVDAFPDERFAGELIFIARQAEFTPNNVQTPEDRAKQVFRIKVRVLEALDRLRPGMLADVWLDGPEGKP